MIRTILLVRNLSFKFLFAVLTLPATNLYAQASLPTDVFVCPTGNCFCYVKCKDGTSSGYARGERNNKCSVTKEDRDYADAGCKNHNGVSSIVCTKHIYPPEEGGPSVVAVPVG
jgi:hypothetical protein